MSSSRFVRFSPRRCSISPSPTRPPPWKSDPNPIAPVLAVTSRSPVATRTPASSKRVLAKPPGTSRKVIVPAAGGLFFPQSKSLGLDQAEASPAILAKVVYAGTVARSFGQASDALQQLADLPLPEKQVERVTQRLGAERVAERVATVAAYQALP